MPFSVRFRYNWTNIFNPFVDESRMTYWAAIVSSMIVFAIPWLVVHFCLITFPVHILLHPRFLVSFYPYIVLAVSLPSQLNVYMAWFRRLRSTGWRWPLLMVGTLLYIVLMYTWWHGGHLIATWCWLVALLALAFKQNWRTESTNRWKLRLVQGYGQVPDTPERFKGKDLAFSHPERIRRRDNPEDYDDDDE